ncbi:MAG: BTAD domain-containing putative transcriptional regulator [Coriobacteriia bacterium]|nr:BTAD domain-containing putative transcriptional regulator [Coriobacteriia bacterium]
MHEYAAEVYTDSERLLHLESTIESVVPRVLDYMESTGELERMFRLLLRMGCAEEIESRLERTGLDLLNQGHGALLLELLENVQAARMISCPQLLLVKAMALRHVRQFDEALRLAKVARTVSTTAKNGEHVGVQAAIVMARVFVDLGQYEAIIECLRDVMESQVLLDDSNAHCLALGYLAAAYASTGNTEIALETTSRAREMLKRPGIAVQARCATSMCCAGALVILLGDFRTSGDMMGNLAMDPNVPLSFATQARGNLAATLCEIGQVHRALDIAREASLQCRNMGLMVLAESFMGTEAAALAGLGEMSDAAAMMRRCLDASAASGDVYSGELERNYLGAILRANGKRDEALAESERSYAYFSANSSDFVVDVGWAEVELAASLLAVGDVASAVRHAEHALTLFEGLGAPHHVLRCHLVLAEIARLSNQVRQAHDWLLGDSEYLCSGNGNWLLAMYIRAFPGLLGLVAAAVGVDRLPVHMLRMIMPEHARAALPLARDVLDEDSWRRLAVRLLGEDEALALESSFLGKPLVHVRLFGGLEVVTPEGVVPDRAWKKRKARLLFMMLVTRQGRDVPRDMLLEHLWPDMDEERAKNNFYVIWSAMKRALLPAGKAAPCPYVEHVGGICRAVRPLVRSDLDDFDESVAALNKAEAAGCLADVLGAGRRIREIYRSDLLPSELYDDWFRPLRERYRVQFGDTMLRVGRMCRDADDLEQAVQFTRAGLEHDPWREDLYQAAIRYQIDTGQRSGAVDMFMTCRAKLAEDLGLDPSVETRRLYEEVLAMEESSQR